MSKTERVLSWGTLAGALGAPHRGALSLSGSRSLVPPAGRGGLRPTPERPSGHGSSTNLPALFVHKLVLESEGVMSSEAAARWGAASVRLRPTPTSAGGTPWPLATPDVRLRAPHATRSVLTLLAG